MRGDFRHTRDRHTVQIFLCVLLLSVSLAGLQACSLRVAPSAPLAAIGPAGPDYIRQRRTPLSELPALNFFTPVEIRAASRQRTGILIATSRQAGRDVFQPPSDDSRFRRLSALFSQILSVSHLAGQPLYPVLITGPEFQALTFGGDEVIFYTGLSSQLDDDELAFVIAHEIGHIAAAHIAQQSSRGVINVYDENEYRRSSDLAAIRNETEADSLGLIYALRAGYDLKKAIRFWARLADTPEDNLYDLFVATHPPGPARFSYLRQAADKLMNGPSDYRDDSYLSCNPLYCPRQ